MTVLKTSLFTIRALNPTTDLTGLAALYRQVQPDPVTPEALQTMLSRIPAASTVYYVVAVDEDETLLGVASSRCDPWLRPELFRSQVMVLPSRRGQGIGRALYDQVHTFNVQHEARRVRLQVRDDDPTSLAFALRRGFEVQRHFYESALAMTAFDSAMWKPVIDQVQGITFMTLADLGNQSEQRRQLYALHAALSKDMPNDEGPFQPWDDYEREVLHAPWFDPSAQWLALDGERWVGLAMMQYDSDEGSGYHWFTGVDRAYRGRHVALALKLLTLQDANRRSIRRVVTNNDSRNAPMLAINRKLGYQPEPGWYRVEQVLDVGSWYHEYW